MLALAQQQVLALVSECATWPLEPEQPSFELPALAWPPAAETQPVRPVASDTDVPDSEDSSSAFEYELARLRNAHGHWPGFGVLVKTDSLQSALAAQPLPVQRLELRPLAKALALGLQPLAQVLALA